MAVSPNSIRVKWLSDLDKFVLVSNFERRGWTKGSSEGTRLTLDTYHFIMIHRW